MTNSVLKLSLSAIGLIGGVGLSIFGFQYFQRNSTEKLGGYYQKKGFKVTSYDDSIWEEEFERYKRSFDMLNSKALASADELRSKCKELTESKADYSDNDDNDSVAFAKIFCMGRTTLKNWIEQFEKRGIINTDGDEAVWNKIASIIDTQDKQEIGIKNDISDNEELKKGIKDFCKKANWDQEIRLSDERTRTILDFCTFPKLDGKFIIN